MAMNNYVTMKIEIIIFLKISEDDLWEVVGGNVWIDTELFILGS